ncbi:MAG: Sec-independent protein translocase protein TatB, partial [Pseudomonadota bacterium]
MFDLGWTELLVIGIVALIVVGPKDLPGMFRTVGKFMGKARGMAREFSRAMNEAADDAGVSEVSKTLKAATNPVGSAMNEVKKSTESFTARTMAGPKPKEPEFDEERQKMAERISKKSAEVAEKRMAAEKAEAGAGKTVKSETPVTPAKPAVEKPARATPAAQKKPAAKKPANKKPAA